VVIPLRRQPVRRRGGRSGTAASMFELSGGRLCLDFANTVSKRPSDHPEELLNSYGDLVSWSQQAGLAAEREVRALLQGAKRHPATAAAVLERAIALREAIYRIFSAVAGERAARASDLATLNAALAEALPRLGIVPKGNRFAWEWTANGQRLDRMLWPVTQSAADLLTSRELPQVRECEAQNCGWLFMDRSRNRSRRWCDMKVCGNRAKARRHYERKRAGRGGRSSGKPGPGDERPGERMDGNPAVRSRRNARSRQQPQEHETQAPAAGLPRATPPSRRGLSVREPGDAEPAQGALAALARQGGPRTRPGAPGAGPGTRPSGPSGGSGTPA